MNSLRFHSLLLFLLFILPILLQIHCQEMAKSEDEQQKVPSIDHFHRSVSVEDWADQLGPMEKRRRRRGTKTKALVGGALTGLGAAIIYNAFKKKKIEQKLNFS
uniref:Hypothetical secreted protein n=1 Tax=Heterodera schachtii TaxID=97005 RepID=Q9GRU7_HETSC|nr:hypothetical secreted protein [Heterodera schachtii]